MVDKPLDAWMDNVTAWNLGRIARQAGDPARTDVGDPIDRGLILVRMLREGGFNVIQIAEVGK